MEYQQEKFIKLQPLFFGTRAVFHLWLSGQTVTCRKVQGVPLGTGQSYVGSGTDVREVLGVHGPHDDLHLRGAPHPARIPGEIQVRGDVVTEGYYNNPEATAAAFTSDGWLKTGDMAIRDRKGHIYIKGRCKNMILTGSGQNIYPEEIEELINSLPMVVESLVVSRKFAIVALVVLDKETAADEEKRAEVERQVFALNAKLPAYSQISLCEMRVEPFEKTPKQSIKRFMYN